ncbi:MAG: hypothetical protein DDT42_01928 [candidate division WS2 bacterium]|uniref:Uncharacterized protein n=1 Tax=Psychracetigena formicireducens TaxID=2986056 RepID=A0A9E2BN62_PSYF1|nr:hypothetical protein [Candidatus Psychracetigena formicireducens]
MLKLVTPLTQVDSSPLYALNSRTITRDGNEFIYLEGVAGTLANSWVTFNAEGRTALAATGARGRAGIAMAAIVAARFGWYQIYGSAVGRVLAGFVNNGLVYLTTTAGSVSNTVVAANLVVGAIGRSAVVGEVATIELNYPFATNVVG